MDLIEWDIYEITSDKENLHGVKLRGRIRKFGLVNQKNILVENVDIKDGANKVRFAVEHNSDASPIKKFIESLIPGADIKLILQKIKNPILSRKQINNESRYNLE